MSESPSLDPKLTDPFDLFGESCKSKLLLLRLGVLEIKGKIKILKYEDT